MPDEMRALAEKVPLQSVLMVSSSPEMDGKKEAFSHSHDVRVYIRLDPVLIVSVGRTPFKNTFILQVLSPHHSFDWKGALQEEMI